MLIKHRFYMNLRESKTAKSLSEELELTRSYP